MKPVTSITAFAGLPPPWSLPSLDSNFSAIALALNDLGTYSNPLVDNSGVANSISVAVSAPLTAALSFGLLIFVQVANTNTSTTVSLNLGGTGSVPVITQGGTSVPVASLVSGGIYGFIYDGANWQVINGTFIYRGTATVTLGPLTPGNASTSGISLPIVGVTDVVAVTANFQLSNVIPFGQCTFAGQLTLGLFSIGATYTPGPTTFYYRILK